MNLKNSIENIELCKLGEFASSLSTKYKFIKYKDIIDIWNCTIGGQAQPPPPKKSRVCKPIIGPRRSRGPILGPPVKHPQSGPTPKLPFFIMKNELASQMPATKQPPTTKVASKKKIIIDEDFDFFVASIKNKKKFILDEEEFIISKNRKHINVKIEDSIINKASPPLAAASPRSPPSDRVSARPCNGSQAASPK